MQTRTRACICDIQAGLSKMSRGIDEVEKAIQNAGAIEMAFLEKI